MAKPAIYDPDDKKAVTKPPDLHVLPGSGDNPEILKKAEENGGVDSSAAGDASEVAQEQSALGNDQVGEGYNPDDNGRFSKVRGRFSGMSRRKKIIGGGIAGTVITGALIFSIGQGPFQIIHFAQLLQRFHFTNNEDFSDSRTGKFIIYLSTRSNPNRRNLGFIANRPATKYQNLLKEAGIEMNFDHPTKNGRQVRRIQSFTIDSSKPKGQATLDSLRRERVALTDLGDGKFSIDARGRGGTSLSRGVIRASVDSLHLNKVSGALAKRLMILRARLDFHPLRNRTIEKGQDRNDFRHKVRQQDADLDKSGVNKEPDAKVRGTQDLDGDGNVNRDTRGAANAGQAEVEASRGTKGPEELRGLRARYGGLIQGAGLAAAGVGVVCAVRGLGDQAEAIEHTNIVLPLMRMGTRIVSTGNQAMSGQGFNLDELGAVSSALYSEENGSWTNARSIQAELGQEQTGPDINDEAKPSQVGKKSEFFQILDNPVLDATCSVGSFLGSIPILKEIGQVANLAINKALSVFGWSMEKLMNSLASLIAAEEVDALATGAVLGNYANYGTRLTANDSAISMGGRALTDTETTQLNERRYELIAQEFRQQSFFARIFNPNSANSLVGKAILSTPKSLNEVIAAIFKAPLSISSLFAPKVHAQDTYDYGFPKFGFSLDEQEDERLEDPMENADFIEPRLANLNQRYTGCFNTTVSPPPGNGSITSGQAVRYDEIAKDPDCSNPGKTFPDGTTELLRYRMYIADVVNIHSLACFEGAGNSCRQLGFGSGQAKDY